MLSEKNLTTVIIVVGVGLFVFGLSGFTVGRGAGWQTLDQVLMAIGAMLMVSGFLWKRN